MDLMITPDEIDRFLAVLRKHNVMSAHLESGPDKLAVTLGPELPISSAPSLSPSPGGWKGLHPEVSDPQDPDPLGLGLLDAPVALDDEEVEL